MANVNVFSQVILKTKLLAKVEVVKRKIGRKEFMLSLGEEIRRLIQGDTRTGKGVTKDGKAIRLATLSPSYTEWKIRNKGRAFSPGRFFRTNNQSNLTLTGQLLDSINIDSRQNFVRVYVRDIQRRGYGAGVLNSEIAKWQASAGRSFMGISKQNRRILDKEIERETRAIIRRELASK